MKKKFLLVGLVLTISLIWSGTSVAQNSGQWRGFIAGTQVQMPVGGGLAPLSGQGQEVPYMYGPGGEAALLEAIQRSETPEGKAYLKSFMPLQNTIDAAPPLSPPLTASFTGPAWGGIWTPGDPVIAAGQNHVGVMINSQCDFYTKAGIWAGGSILKVFFAPVFDTLTYRDPFDVKIIFDHHNDRWVMLALTYRAAAPQQSRYLVAVSQTINPLGLWWIWALNSTDPLEPAPFKWADYPGLGFDADSGVYITSNQYTYPPGPVFNYAKIRALRKGALYAGVAVWWDYWNMSDADGAVTFTIKPAHTFGNPGMEYLANSKWNGGPPAVVNLWNLVPGGILTNMGAVPIGAHSPPPIPACSDSGLWLFDCRTQDVQYRDEHLYTSFHEEWDWGAGVKAAVRFLKIDIPTMFAVIDERYGHPDMHYFFPTIYSSPNSNIVTVFNRCGYGEMGFEFISARYSTRFLTQGDMASRGSLYLQAGQAAYSDWVNPNRWGDYSGIAYDPYQFCTMWIYSMYATLAPKPANWSTWIGSVFTHPQPDSERNHFKSWRTLPQTFDTTVFVLDQFTEDNLRLTRIEFLSNPVTKDTFEIVDSLDHLTWYKAVGKAVSLQVEYENQFESTTVIIDSVRYLLVPTQKQPHAPPESLDHYKAYRIKDPVAFAGTHTLEDQFDLRYGAPESIESLMPLYFLTPALKNMPPPMFDSITHYVAYEIFPKRFFPLPVNTHDQFGTHVLQVDSSKILLVPTKKLSVELLCNPPTIGCPSDETQNVNGVYTTTTKWTADDGNPANPIINITSVAICGALPPGITAAVVNVDPPGLPAKIATGTVTYTVGDHCQTGGAICLQVTNNCVPPLTNQCTFNVLLTNGPPVINCPPNDTFSYFAGYGGQATATDPDGDAVTFSKLAGPAGLNVASNGAITWTTTCSDVGGPYTVTVVVIDVCGAADTCSFQLTVTNSPPVITQPDTVSGFVGFQLSYTIGGTDPDWDLLQDQASITIVPACGTYSITRISGQGTSSGTWQVAWQTSGCSADTYLVIHDLTDACGVTSYCTTTVFLYPETGWYWKPPYEDYAPNGMPDIDQRQDNWIKMEISQWSLCGPVAVANCFKWFDSKYNIPAGVPCDGVDMFPLVRDYTDMLAPIWCPMPWDDHSPENMDHPATPWSPPAIPPPPPTPQPFVPGPQPPGALPPWGELVERLAWYFNTDGIRTGYCQFTGTDIMQMQQGIDMWLQSETFPDGSTLADIFYERTIKSPSFVEVETLLEMSENVILLLGFWYYHAPLQEFIRGDINANGIVEAGDLAICYAGPPFICDDAADVNDDGIWNILDCDYLNNFLMGMGPPPPFPFPDCGIDPTPDALGCASFPPCPGGPGEWVRVGGHYVTLAGVNSQDSLIAFSDPFFDNAEMGGPGRVRNGLIIPHNPSHDAVVHNDEGNVSHDIYTVTPSPSPGGVWGLPDYPVSISPYYVYRFNGQNVPTEFLPDTGSWNNVDPIFTEVEYAVVISPKVLCNRPHIDCPSDETQHINGVYTTVTQWSATDGNPADPTVNITSVNICGALPPGITGAVVNVNPPGLPSKTATGTVTYTVGDHCQSGGSICLEVINNCTPPKSDSCTFNVLLTNLPPHIEQPDTLSAFVDDAVSYTIFGADPDSDVILDQASIQVVPSCGTYSITRISGQGTASGVWQVSWQTSGCMAGTYLVIHDLTDVCGAVSYCTTTVNLRQQAGWYWKPPYPDYAPSGMPDFDQKQDNWKKLETGQWSFCGPVAVANCFWWFDSKYQVPPQGPGDGFDMFPLVRDYMDNNPPFMGAMWDDHDPWNVDHVATPWSPPGIVPPPPTFPFAPGPQPQPSGMPSWGELVERLAWYFDTDGSRTGYCQHSGTTIKQMKQGIKEWLASEIFIAESLCVTDSVKPTFTYVESLVEKSEDIILLLGFWFEDPQGSGNWFRCGGHYVTVAGVNSEQLQIAFSDPFLDAAEMGLPGRVGNGQIIPHNPGHPAPTHNDAGNVSHDIYTVLQPSPSPGGRWGLTDYPTDCYDFNKQNFPDTSTQTYRPWNGVSPIFTEVEYALHISPWDYRGDVNHSGVVEVGDVLTLINYLYRGGQQPVPYSEGDANCSGLIEVGDILALINYLYKGGPVPKCCDP